MKLGRRFKLQWVTEGLRGWNQSYRQRSRWEDQGRDQGLEDGDRTLKDQIQNPRIGCRGKEKPRERSGGSRVQAESRGSAGNGTARFWVGNIWN